MSRRRQKIDNDQVNGSACSYRATMKAYNR